MNPAYCVYVSVSVCVRLTESSCMWQVRNDERDWKFAQSRVKDQQNRASALWDEVSDSVYCLDHILASRKE